MKLKRIDYAERHPRNIRVNCEPCRIFPTTPPVTTATISLGKTEDPSEDWSFMGGRSYEDGAQGFHFSGSGDVWATVWLECPEGAMTIAEENDPGVLYVVCIPRLLPNVKDEPRRGAA